MIPKYAPSIGYLIGQYAFAQLPTDWANRIADITAREEHLLSQTPENIKRAAVEDRFLVAADFNYQGSSVAIIGFCALWPLGHDDQNQPWYEFGSVWVHPEYRWQQSGIPISDTLYVKMLDSHAAWNILATTTNHHAVGVGRRVGLRHVGYDALPPDVRHATCCCPKEKIGTADPKNCSLRGTKCFVRVPIPTHERMGLPTILPFPPPSASSG